MTSRLVLKIRKRSQPEWLVGYIIAMPFLFYALFDLLPIPTFVKYSLDVSWIFLLLFLIRNRGRGQKQTATAIFLWVMGFVAVTFLVYIYRYQSVLYYLWGMRNNFRFYALFFACVTFLQKRDIEDYLKFFDIMFWINAIVCVIQYAVFGKYGDWLGGLFGTEKGCNGYLNVFFVIITTKTIVSYLSKSESIYKCVSKIGICIIIAAIAELKFYYIEFLFILVAATLITSFSWRKLLIIVLGLLGLSVGARVLAIVFPNSKGFLSLDRMLEYAISNRGYTAAGDINRLTVIPVISQRFLDTGMKQIFGLGVGNCDTASFSFLVTPFFQKHGSIHYLWFSSASIFLEMGYIGLFFVTGFFVLVFFAGIKTKGYSDEDKRHCHTASVVALCCILILLYDATLRVEAGYMMYFVLSFPFVVRRCQQQV